MEIQWTQEDLRERSMGFTGYCGIRIDKVEQGYCEVSIPRLEPHHLNPRGMAHGGLICTLMDVCAGVTAIYAHGETRNIVTQNCDIHYLRPAAGSLRAVGRVLKAGRSTCVSQVELMGEDGQLCAQGSFTLFYLP